MNDKYNKPLKYGCPHYQLGVPCKPEEINGGRFIKDFPDWINNHCQKYHCECYRGYIYPL